MKKQLISMLGAAVLIACFAAAQPNVAGTYSGTQAIDEASVQIKDPKQRKLFEEMLGDYKSVKLTLVLNPNRTFKMTRVVPKQPTVVVDGTYTVTGNTITMKELKHNGKALPDKMQGQSKYTISSDGRTLTQADKSMMMLKVTFRKTK